MSFNAEGSTWYPADGVYGTAYDQDVTYNVTIAWNPDNDTSIGESGSDSVIVNVPAGTALGRATFVRSFNGAGNMPVNVSIDGPYGATYTTPPDSVTGDSSEEPVPATSGSASASILISRYSSNRLRLGTTQTRRVLGDGAFNLEIEANDPASTAAGGIGPVTVNWGDGSLPQDVSTYGPGVNIPHTYTHTGSYNITASTAGSGYGGMSAYGLSFDPSWGTSGVEVGATMPSSSASWRAMARGAGADGAFVAVAPDGDSFLLSIFGTTGGSVSFASLGTDVTATPSAVAVLPDGRILAAGDVLLDGHFSFAMARFNADGTTDSTFGSEGLVTTSFGSSVDARANAIAIDPTTGNITLAGFAGSDVGVAQYTPDGLPDTMFSSDGIDTINIGSLADIAYGATIDAQGRILLAGRKGDDMAVVRLLSSGAADTLFGDSHDGHEIINFGSSDYAYSVDIDSQGRIVVGGEATSGVAYVAVARLTDAGALDTSFGTGGKVWTSVKDRSAYVRNVSVDESDRVLAAGGANGSGDTLYGSDGGPAVLLLRLTTAGALDSTFGDGVYALPQSNLYDASASTVVSANGKTYMGGAFRDEGGWHAAIWAYAPQNTVAVYTVPPVSIAAASGNPDTLVAGADYTIDLSARQNTGDDPISRWVIHAGSLDILVSGNPSTATFALPAGQYDITADAIGSHGDVYSAPNPISVQTAPLMGEAVDIYSVAGEEFTGTIARFWDLDTALDASSYFATILWADGTSALGTVAANDAGGFDVTATRTFSADEQFRIIISSTNWSYSDDLVGMATVGSASSISVFPTTILADQGIEFDDVVARFRDGTSPGAYSSYTASIDWGDGNSGTGSVSQADDGTFIVSGDHTFATAGDMDIVVTITRSGESSPAGDLTQTVTVGAAISGQATDLYAVAGQSFTSTLARFQAADPDAVYGDFTATITWPDSTTSTGTVTADSNGGFDVNITHTLTGGGDYSVEIDDGDSSAIITGVAHVGGSNSVSVFGLTNIQALEDTEFEGGVAMFSDGASAGSAGDYTATIDWGDGSSTSAGVITTAANGTFTVTGDHTFPADSVLGSGGSDSFTGSVTVTRTALTSHTMTTGVTLFAAQATGLGAKHQWTDTTTYAGKTLTYESYYAKWIVTHPANFAAKTYNSGDFAIYPLVHFAYENGLPIDIYSGGGHHKHSYLVASDIAFMNQMIDLGFNSDRLWTRPKQGQPNTILKLTSASQSQDIISGLNTGQVVVDTHGYANVIQNYTRKNKGTPGGNYRVYLQNGTLQGARVSALLAASDTRRIVAFNFAAWHLTQPTVLSATPSDTAPTSSIDVTWDDVGAGATYTLYRNTSNNFSTASVIFTGSATMKTDTGRSNNSTYFYWVVATRADGVQLPRSDFRTGTTRAAAPTGVRVVLHDNATAGAIEEVISWAAVTGATAYHVYRRTNNGTESWIHDTTSLNWTDATVTLPRQGHGVTGTVPDPDIYYYTVTATVGGVETAHSLRTYAPQIYWIEGGGDTQTGHEQQLDYAQRPGIQAEVHYFTWNDGTIDGILRRVQGPLVLMGYSFGGARAVQVADILSRVTMDSPPLPARRVDYFVTMDPVRHKANGSLLTDPVTHDVIAGPNFDLPLSVDLNHADNWLRKDYTTVYFDGVDDRPPSAPFNPDDKHAPNHVLTGTEVHHYSTIYTAGNYAAIRTALNRLAANWVIS